MALTRRILATALVAVLAAVSPAVNANINITSPAITNWGVWGRMQYCPNGRYAQGFQLKTEPNQFFGDDTALNAIRLFCGDPYYPDTAVVTSTEGEFGDWGRVFTCYPGNLTGFQLRSESDRGSSGDNTAANNIRFFCSSLGNPNEYIQGDGMSWGEWSASQHCYGGQAICSIQTQVEPYQGSGDDTSLNNVRFECCNPRALAASEAQEKVTTVKDLNIWGALPFNPKLIPLIMKNIEQLEHPGEIQN